jgi:hypothetical protein
MKIFRGLFVIKLRSWAIPIPDIISVNERSDLKYTGKTKATKAINIENH